MAAIAINCPLCRMQMRAPRVAVALARYARHLRTCAAFKAACGSQKADPVASAAHLVSQAREEHARLIGVRH